MLPEILVFENWKSLEKFLPEEASYLKKTLSRYNEENPDHNWQVEVKFLQKVTYKDLAFLQCDMNRCEQFDNWHSKKRREINGDKIRALYGHSVPEKINKIEATLSAALSQNF